jgi:hypothetical protein
MSTNNTGNFNVKGDGNAFGNNNQVTVIKQDNRRTSYGGNGGKNDGGGEVAIFVGLVVAVSMGVVASGYYFAKHAHVIYSFLKLTGVIEAATAFFAALVFYKRRADHELLKSALIFAILVLANISLFSAHQSYPQSLIDLALQAATYKDFWCRLSLYGQQLSLLHVFTSAFGYVIGLLVLTVPIAVYGVFAVHSFEVSEATYVVLEKMTSWTLIILGTTFLALAMFGQSKHGWDAWTKFHDKPQVQFICKK